jgi:hypothetical protein
VLRVLAEAQVCYEPGLGQEDRKTGIARARAALGLLDYDSAH